MTEATHTRAGITVPNWRRPDPRADDRDRIITKLAFVDGLGAADIAVQIKAMGFAPVTPDRISQVLNAHSGRERVIRFLAMAPEGSAYSSKEIAIALSIEINRIQYVLDGLAKRNIVTFRDVRNGPDSGDHKTKVDIHLTKKAKTSKIVTSVMSRPAVGSPQILEDDNPTETLLDPEHARADGLPDEDETGAAPGHATRVIMGARKLQEEINALGAGPKPGNSGPGSDEDWGPTTAHPDQPRVILPWIKGSLGGFPVIRSLRDRAIKAQKLNAAAKILEEAGEDDMVLALMAKTEFTGLEAEVISLLRTFGEIE